LHWQWHWQEASGLNSEVQSYEWFMITFSHTCHKIRS